MTDREVRGNSPNLETRFGIRRAASYVIYVCIYIYIHICTTPYTILLYIILCCIILCSARFVSVGSHDLQYVVGATLFILLLCSFYCFLPNEAHFWSTVSFFSKAVIDGEVVYHGEWFLARASRFLAEPGGHRALSHRLIIDMIIIIIIVIIITTYYCYYYQYYDSQYSYY